MGVKGEVLNDVEQVMGVLDAKDVGNGMWLLEWESGASHDMIADSTFALLTSIDKSPASAKRASYH